MKAWDRRKKCPSCHGVGDYPPDVWKKDCPTCKGLSRDFVSESIRRLKTKRRKS